MKKPAIVAGAIVAAAAAYSGVAWYVGLEAEKRIRVAVERSNERIAEAIGSDSPVVSAKLEVSEYDRGVFASNARYTLTVNDGQGQRQFGLYDHMQHGPFPWDLLKNGDLAPLLAYSQSRLDDTEAVKHWFDAARAEPPFKAETLLRLDGEG